MPKHPLGNVSILKSYLQTTRKTLVLSQFSTQLPQNSEAEDGGVGGGPWGLGDLGPIAAACRLREEGRSEATGGGRRRRRRGRPGPVSVEVHAQTSARRRGGGGGSGWRSRRWRRGRTQIQAHIAGK